MKHMNALFRAVAVPVALVAGLSLAPGMAIAFPTDGETAGILITLDEETSRALAAQAEGGIQLLSEEPVMGDLAQAGVEVTGSSVSHDGDVVLAADAGEGMSDAEALEAARDIDGVAEVQYNFVYHIIESPDSGSAIEGVSLADTLGTLSALPVNDPFAARSEADSNRNQYWAYDTNLIDTWKEHASDHAVTVAVLDTGAQLDHVDLRDSLLTDLAYDATLDKPLASCEIQDCVGHGTHVAGIVGATANNGIGLAGASYNADILPIKVQSNAYVDEAGKHHDGSISTQSLTAAYEHLFGLIEDGKVNNLRVVNMSLGGYGNAATDQIFHEAIIEARDEYGIITVCSGGNGDQSSTPRTDNMYPADFDECVSVTALEPDGTNIVWSDYNDAKDISAPGRSIWSTALDSDSNNMYKTESGTSEASPIVAGTIALMYAAKPDATVDEILGALYRTAEPVVDPVNDRSETSGSHGALDADAALEQLLASEEEPEEESLPFADVAADAWYYSQVKYVYEKGIMGGYSETEFGPENAVLREQVATILYRYFGEPAVNGGADYSDAASGAYYEDAIVWAEQQGFMSGYGDGRFGVGEPLTREQLAIVVANVADAEIERANDTKFNALPDHNTVNGWARDEVVWAVDTGIINGVEQPGGVKLLSPQQTCTRAQMATIFMNCVEQDII